MRSVHRALPAADPHRRLGSDRLELLEALINGPSFDPLFRGEDVLDIPADHPKYGWGCAVPKCERTRNSTDKLCHSHAQQWKLNLAQAPETATMAAFLTLAQPLELKEGGAQELCAICPNRPAASRTSRLCLMHAGRWGHLARTHPDTADLSVWMAAQEPYPHGFGTCRVSVCDLLADGDLGLCAQHRDRHRMAGRPGGELGTTGEPGLLAFEEWCARETPVYRIGQVVLTGLRPLAAAELRWGLDAHARDNRRLAAWTITDLRALTNSCRAQEADSLSGLDLEDGRGRHHQIAREILSRLRPLYYTKEDSRAAGFIDTEHFGRRFPQGDTVYDLTAVQQSWLRDVLWDHLARLLQSVDCPRSSGPVNSVRRALSELGAFLAVDAPEAGNDPTLLTAAHAERFAADQRHRAAAKLPSLIVRYNGAPAVVTAASNRTTFNYIRKVLYELLERGESDELGLDRAFIAALPRGGRLAPRKRRPFDDDLARALANDDNLQRFAETWDENDRGLRDIWETLVYTGRRGNEVVRLRYNCISHLYGAPMLWHDQTKVGNLDEGIRIPEYLYQRLDARRRTTLLRFERRQGRMPAALEQEAIALFPSNKANPDETKALSYGFFSSSFREWVETLDLGRGVPHQARHTLATKLLKAGASLTHVKKYLGQVSEAMAEHYVDIASTDLDDVLQRVWVSGPGAEHPGEPLFNTGLNPLSNQAALALAVDVGRRCTPTLGGLCTAQVVVEGGKCPRNLDCDNCDKLVMTGADLLYWRRKREQWHSIAERAPDDATADYLHKVFEPTSRAIDGLERALAGLGLLDQALAMDLRRPQDYFSHMWNTGFPVEDLDTDDEEEVA